MARTFRRRQTAPPISELNVTNLIDLGFTLLIIFMIAAPLINEQTIPLKLPTESKNAQPKIDRDTQFHSVSVAADGQYYLDSSRSGIGLPELRVRLQSYAAEPKKPVIRIRGDASVAFGKIVEVLDELKKLDLTSITVDTQTPN